MLVTLPVVRPSWSASCRGGYIPGLRVDVPPWEFRMQFGTRCFFAWMPTPDGGTIWFANPPMARQPERGVLSGMPDEQWRQWLHELMDGDAGPSGEIIDAAPGPMVGWATYDMPVVRRWHNNQNMIIIGDAAHATAPSRRPRCVDGARGRDHPRQMPARLC